MQIKADTAQLAACLETVEKALPVRTTVPVIGNILMEASPNKLIFSATNHEIFIKVTMNYNGSETGSVLLPPKIVDIIRYFPTPEVIIDINWDNYRVDISGGSADFHIYGASTEDFPVASLNLGGDADNSFNLDLSHFRRLLKEVIFAASTEETRPAFNGILFSYKDNKLNLTSSDTYRLALKEISDDKWSFVESRNLIPARALREFLRIAGDSQVNIEVNSSKNLLSLEFENIHFASRLLEEKYPDVSGVIPTEYLTRISIGRKIFEDTISRAALLAEGKNQAVHVTIDEDRLEAKVNGQEGSMEEVIPVKKDGANVDLLVNSRYVLDILKIMNSDEVIVDFHGNGGPIIFRLPEDSSYLYLVLPIKKIN
jgi:DNA polymerase III subunit beta